MARKFKTPETIYRPFLKMDRVVYVTHNEAYEIWRNKLINKVKTLYKFNAPLGELTGEFNRNVFETLIYEGKVAVYYDKTIGAEDFYQNLISFPFEFKEGKKKNRHREPMVIEPNANVREEYPHIPKELIVNKDVVLFWWAEMMNPEATPIKVVEWFAHILADLEVKKYATLTVGNLHATINIADSPEQQMTMANNLYKNSIMLGVTTRGEPPYPLPPLDERVKMIEEQIVNVYNRALSYFGIPNGPTNEKKAQMNVNEVQISPELEAYDRGETFTALRNGCLNFEDVFGYKLDLLTLIGLNYYDAEDSSFIFAVRGAGNMLGSDPATINKMRTIIEDTSHDSDERMRRGEDIGPDARKDSKKGDSTGPKSDKKPETIATPRPEEVKGDYSKDYQRILGRQGINLDNIHKEIDITPNPDYSNFYHGLFEELLNPEYQGAGEFFKDLANTSYYQDYANKTYSIFKRHPKFFDKVYKNLEDTINDLYRKIKNVTNLPYALTLKIASLAVGPICALLAMASIRRLGIHERSLRLTPFQIIAGRTQRNVAKTTSIIRSLIMRLGSAMFAFFRAGGSSMLQGENPLLAFARASLAGVKEAWTYIPIERRNFYENLERIHRIRVLAHVEDMTESMRNADMNINLFDNIVGGLVGFGAYVYFQYFLYKMFRNISYGIAKVFNSELPARISGDIAGTTAISDMLPTETAYWYHIMVNSAITVFSYFSSPQYYNYVRSLLRKYIGFRIYSNVSSLLLHTFLNHERARRAGFADDLRALGLFAAVSFSEDNNNVFENINQMAEQPNPNEYYNEIVHENIQVSVCALVDSTQRLWSGIRNVFYNQQGVLHPNEWANEAVRLIVMDGLNNPSDFQPLTREDFKVLLEAVYYDSGANILGVIDDLLPSRQKGLKALPDEKRPLLNDEGQQIPQPPDINQLKYIQLQNQLKKGKNRKLKYKESFAKFFERHKDNWKRSVKNWEELEFLSSLYGAPSMVQLYANLPLKVTRNEAFKRIEKSLQNYYEMRVVAFMNKISNEDGYEGVRADLEKLMSRRLGLSKGKIVDYVKYSDWTSFKGIFTTRSKLSDYDLKIKHKNELLLLTQILNNSYKDFHKILDQAPVDNHFFKRNILTGVGSAFVIAALTNPIGAGIAFTGMMGNVIYTLIDREMVATDDQAEQAALLFMKYIALVGAGNTELVDKFIKGEI